MIRQSVRAKKRIGWWSAAGGLVIAAAALLLLRPDRAAQVGAGLTAHNLCSAVFVAGLDPDATYRELVQPMLGVAARWASYRIDHAGQSVTASLAGLGHSRAHFTQGYGCRLEYPRSLSPPAPRPILPGPAPDAFAPAGQVVSTDAVIAAAIAQAFTEHAEKPSKHVKAVVIVKDGHVVAERYAPGFTLDTPLLSYSVAKSFTNAILGVLVRQGRLQVSQPVGAPEWSGARDPRRYVSVEDLLQMHSGLDARESVSPFDPVARMLYAQNDMAGFAARHDLKTPPNTVFEYTSANTLILARLLGQVIGGGAAGMRDFAQRELFAPLHMSGVTMEFDGAGVFIGSSYVYAPARAYARLGELYLNDGLTPDGSRILPEGWVSFSRHSTLAAPYGAGFWTNDGPSEEAADRIAHGFPKDGFFASGILGQRIYILPSAHLVIARFGYSGAPDFGMTDDLALIRAVVQNSPATAAD
jgi:CubicO group peptidase (beta-lactamase class C family)